MNNNVDVDVFYDYRQILCMQAKIDAGLEDITGSWPPPPEPIAEPTPIDPVTKLKDFLAANPDVAAIITGA